MAKPKRIKEVTRTWTYKGQTKEHVTTYYVAIHHDDRAIADARNDNPEIKDGQREYADACHTGVAQIVGLDERFVG